MRAYAYQSRTWGGGSVATIIKKDESVCEGYAVMMSSDEIKKLDYFETHPVLYIR